MNTKPNVSVVIPTRSSQAVLRTTVESLLCQTLRPLEIIVVASRNSPTRDAMADFIASGTVTYMECDAPEYVRDAHIKRHFGASRATGDYIFFTDSKSPLERHALERAMTLATTHNMHAVAGAAISWKEDAMSFLAKIQDKGLIRNNPKFPNFAVLTQENFGSSESLPVTTAYMLSQTAFEAVKDEFGLAFSKVASTYDDYALAWLTVKSGFPIILTNTVISYHKHRIDWKGYLKQIARCGQSAAIFAKYYPDCPFAKRRIIQVASITALHIFMLLCFFAALALWGSTALIYTISLAVVSFFAAGIVNAVVAKDMHALLMPPVTYVLIMNFCWHFIAWSALPTRAYQNRLHAYIQV